MTSAAVRPRAWLALSTAAAVAVILGVQGISPALPAVAEELDVSNTEIGLLIAAFMLPAVVFAVPLGYLADRLGRRSVFVSMALLFGIAGGAQAAADDLETLLGLRFVQGIGFGALMSLSVTMVGDVFRGATQLRAQARRQIVVGAGEFIMPLVGAALASIGWRWAFAAQAVLIPIGLVGLFVLTGQPATTPSTRYARDLSQILGRPGMLALMAAGCLRFLYRFALLAYLPVMLVQDNGATLGEAGLVLSVGAGVAAAVGLAAAPLLRCGSASRVLGISIAAVGCSLVCYALVPNWQLALAVSVLFGLGDGTLIVIQTALVTEAAPDVMRAGVVALSGMARNLGKLAAPLAMGALAALLPIPASFAVLGASAWLALPGIASVRALDDLLRPQATPSSDGSPGDA